MAFCDTIMLEKLPHPNPPPFHGEGALVSASLYVVERGKGGEEKNFYIKKIQSENARDLLLFCNCTIGEAEYPLSFCKGNPVLSLPKQ